MKHITLKVTIEVPDDYIVDEPSWLLEDCFSGYSESECEIIGVSEMNDD